LAKIIGLHGKMHTGKSAIAKILKQKDPNGIVVRSFAGKLREVLGILNIPEHRDSMQKLGQGLRDVYSEVWVNAVRRDVEKDLHSGYTVIFDDVRYPNEFDYIRGEKGLLIKLYAEDDVRWERYKTSPKFDPSIPSSVARQMWEEKQRHVSELMLDDLDLRWNLEVNTNNLSRRDMNGVAEALAISIQAMRNVNGRRNLDC